ncbi:MAG: hypothetical protein ACRDI2_13095 [Chloroflexota bacterium]
MRIACGSSKGQRLGTTGGDRVAIAPHVELPLAAALTTHRTALGGAVRA